MLVMLKGNWPSDVHCRTVRDAKGYVVKTLYFRHGEPLLLETEAERDAVADAIGHSLVEVALDAKGRPRILTPDPEPAPADTAPAESGGPEGGDTPDASGESDESGEPAAVETVDDLPLTNPYRKALQDAGLGRVEDLVAYVESGKKLTDIRGIGAAAAKSVTAALAGLEEE